MCGGKGTPPNCKLCCKLYLSLSHGNLPWLPITYGRKAMLLSETCRVHLLSTFSCPPHPLPSWITCNTSDMLCFLLSTWVHICSSILTGKFFSCLSLWGCRQLHCWSPPVANRPFYHSMWAASCLLLGDWIHGKIRESWEDKPITFLLSVWIDFLG